MKINFLISGKNNRRLILIYTGWSTGPELYHQIRMPGWDVAVVSCYDDLNLNLDFLERYFTIYVFAWSMGVWGAEQTLPPHRVTAAFAINGTPYPVDDKYGIPSILFKGTADNLNPRNLTKFRRRMLPDNSHISALFPQIPSDKDVDSLKNQLYFIISASGCKRPSQFPWVRAYIGRNDHIFPPDNMRRAWKEDPDVSIIETDNYHYPDMEDVIRNVIADTFKVSRRFYRAGKTYDSYAFAQKLTAFRLAEMIPASLRKKVGRMLEIGPGTGNLTYALSSFLNPAHADFVDITETGPFGIAESEHYHIEDAEIWMSANNSSYDLITSASAIQWFADIPRFFSDCARLMHPSGLLAISTFAPGNLEELDNYRTSPIIYKSKEWYIKILERHFEIIRIEEDEIKMEFESRRHMLLHLHKTGVGGSVSGGRNPFSDNLDIRSLTYRPIYILARPKRKFPIN